MIVKEIIKTIEKLAPPALAESYDNVGLAVGNPSMSVTGVIVTLDVVEETVEEAISRGANMIVSHHPLIFKPLKSLTGKNYIERVILKAIANNIAIYCAHTNIDVSCKGVSHALARELGLKHIKVLKPREDNIVKLIIYSPFNYSNDIRKVLSDMGAGLEWPYDSCSFSSIGEKRYRPIINLEYGKELGSTVTTEKEEKIETLVQKHLLDAILAAVERAHPYNEINYELVNVSNKDIGIGYGTYGELAEPMTLDQFLLFTKEVLGLSYIKYSEPKREKISRVAVCGGSGASFISDAVAVGADIYMTGDFKYHDYFNTDSGIILADIGHYESEQFILNTFCEVLQKNFINFAVRKSDVRSNPIHII